MQFSLRDFQAVHLNRQRTPKHKLLNSHTVDPLFDPTRPIIIHAHASDIIPVANIWVPVRDLSRPNPEHAKSARACWETEWLAQLAVVISRIVTRAGRENADDLFKEAANLNARRR